MWAFAKYFDKTFFDVDVITLQVDSALMEEQLTNGVFVYRLPNRMLFRKATFNKSVPYVIHKLKAFYNVVLYTFFKNEYADWQKRAERKLMELLTLYDNDTTVISSYEPMAPHLAVLSLKQKGVAFHWVADCRDEMANNPSLISSLKKAYTKIEQAILLNADILSTVSKPILDNFLATAGNKYLIGAEIRNGFDFEFEEKLLHNEIFTVVSAGTFYGKRKPYVFFTALERFLLQNPTKKVRLKLIGAGNSVIVPSSLFHVVETLPKVSHEGAIAQMRQADCLLLILPKVVQKGVYSGKLFEYLGCKRPILATVDKTDVAADLIQKCNAGFVADFDDVQEIEQCIEQAYTLWERKESLPMNDELIMWHHRKNQVKILNDLIINSFYTK
jgi:glycosyltransferase involved in cell wall biosynthesis